MLLNRRRAVRLGFVGCVSVAVRPLSLPSQPLPSDSLEVIVTVLKAQYNRNSKHPLLIARTPFSTGRMTVLATRPTALQRATHQVELPYLAPPAERVSEAEALAAAYNDSLQVQATFLEDTPAFNFPVRLLDKEAVSQFQALYPGGNVYSPKLEKRRRAVSRRYQLLFDGSTTIWEVSRVAFASSGTLAVVGLRSSGGSCSSESWKVLERLQGAWHDLPWGAELMTCA